MTIRDWTVIAMVYIVCEFLWRIAHRIVLVAAIACAALATQAYSTPRPATEAESKVIRDAAYRLQQHGLPVQMPVVLVTDDALDCGGKVNISPDPSDPLMVDPAACAYKGRILLLTPTAAMARTYTHATSYTNPSRRRRAFAACDFTCSDVREVAFHELVHVWRFTIVPYAADWVSFREEGYATGVAQDEVCAVVWRDKTRECSNLGSYTREVNTFRWQSSQATHGPWQGIKARAWRLAQVVGGES